jgi:two-component system, NarL family, sensor histidine kinase LiaS
VRSAARAASEYRELAGWPPGKTVEKKSNRRSPGSVDAVAEERQRISRELHDRVLQLLSSARLRAESSRRQLLNNRRALEKELFAIEENIDKAITEIRNLLTESQNSDELQPGSLERRLKEELEIFRSRTGFKIDFRCAIGVQNMPPIVERELYFTLREGILNAVRHSRASELHLTLTATPEGCVANLRDNGVGFEPASSDNSSHYGLKGMKERIQKIGGKMSVTTSPGEGTDITIIVPFEHR